MTAHTMSRKIALMGLLTIALCTATGGMALAWIDNTINDNGYCNICHTGGFATTGTLKPEYQGNDGCVNCHSHATSSTTYLLFGGGETVEVPVVYYTGSTAPTDYLAGGNFWWIAQGTGAEFDRKGHNVFSDNPDDNLSAAPGSQGGCHGGGNCHSTLHDSFNGLRQGCTKCHMTFNLFAPPSGYHHRVDTGPVIDSEAEGWFRFLERHMTPMGVSGIEDDDWQATSGPSDHNEYRGFSASKMSAGGFQNLGNTMTGYCTGCHGNFHIEDTLGDGTWERHPSDAVLPNSGEFANAFGAGGSGTGTYDPGVPVARPETGGTFDWSGADSNVYVGTGQDMAMCLSCHRAHGSPYPKMLRWDYTATAAPGPGSDRCFTCHTQKDHEGGGVSGPCRECHTMHNSEDGSDMQTGYDSTPGLGEVKSTLLRYNDCVGCHTAEDNTTAIDPDTGAPIVYNTVEPIANTLAGGNFWWVEQDTGDGLEDSKGHNAFSDNEDNNLTVAPGVPVGAQNTCGDPNTSCHFRLHNVDPSQGTRQGCTKCHMMRDNTFKEHHHADDSNIVVGSEGLDTDAFFRFIQGHMSGGGWGVSGIEDDDWEYTVSAADHNEYLGKSFEPKTYQQITPFTSIGTTMTAYCCGCHGVFHYEKDASNNWIRHPSDAVLPDSGEFDLYTVFNPDAPVARPATSATRDDFVNWSAADSEVVPGEDFVMCLSCHRAHGSPYPKMLRWDPTAADACVACHTVKVSETQGQYHYTGVADCNVCHAHHGEGPPNYVETGNLGLIDNVISTPISGDKAVTFPSGGASDYISDASPWEGVCQVCHTDTDYYQNNGTSPGGTHNAGSDCTTCHIHEGEFLHGGDCETCHGHDAGYEYEPGKFSEGAGTYKSHSTHSENDSDDLMGPNITCGDCHDTNNYPNFKDGQPLETTTACDDCHSPGGHFDGVDAAAVGAKNNWAAGVYNGAGDDLEAGKEQWCATCHDDASDTDTNESALIDGVYAPGIAGVYATPDVTWYSPASVSGPPGFQWMIDDDTGTANTSLFTQAVFDLGSDYLITDIRMYVKDAPDGIIWQVFALNGSNWTRVLGADNPFYSWKTGHSGAGWYQAKLDVSVTARYLRIAKSVGPCFPGTVFEVQYKKDNLSYGYFETGHGIKCSNCHDFSKAHIDGEPRTYAASADNHQEGYRLKLANVVPRDGVGVASADFALCLNCHADEGLVNRDNMTATNFRDDGENVNDHFRHLMDAGGLYFDSDFDGVADSCMTCTSCHNVHGSPTPAMIRHGELINHVPGLNLRYINTTTGEPDGYILGAYPDSSGAETHFWGTGSGSISKNGICNMCHNDAIRYMRSPLNLTMPDPAGFGVITLCPVDLRVIDPDGLIVDKVLNEIDGASYFEGDIDGDGSIDDRIIIPVRKVGEYIVLVLPEPNPDPDDKDTYTLKAMVSNETMLLAEDVPIVPPDSEDEYTVISTESGISTEDSSAAIITVVDGDGNDSGVGTNSSASNTSSASGNGNCFIATAAFGSYADPHVQVLRDFRDEYLLTNMPGRWFVSTYYTYGPFWADRLNTHNGCKPIVRLSLMPLVGLSYFMLKASLATKLLAGFVIMGFVMSCLLWIHGRSVTRKAVFAGG